MSPKSNGPQTPQVVSAQVGSWLFADYSITEIAGVPYGVAAAFKDVNGRPELGAVMIFTDYPPPQFQHRALEAALLLASPNKKWLSADVFRKFKPGRIAADMLSKRVHDLRFQTAGRDAHGATAGNAVLLAEQFGELEALGTVPSKRSAARRTGPRPTYHLEHWSRVAEVFKSAPAGEKYETVRATRETELGEMVTYSQAKRWVERARTEFGLLPKVARTGAPSVASSSDVRGDSYDQEGTQ